MRIGIDIRLKNETGVGRYIQNLVTYLPQLDTTNEYFFIDPQIPWHSIDEQMQMPAIFNSYKLDLVHIPYFNVPIFYTHPFVVTIHDLIINEHDTGRASTRNYLLYKMKRLGYRYIVERAVYRAQAIIVPSEATKHTLTKLYPGVRKNTIHVTYEGSDLPVVSSKYRITNELIKQIISSKYFLHIGNVYPHKNVEMLVEAFSRISNKDMQLVLVGKKNYFTDRLIKKAKKLGIEKRVIFTGHIDDREIAVLYNHAVALILPSLVEGFGLPALEAMKSRCLVLASDIPAFREVCGEAALFFNPKDTHELVSLMESLPEKKSLVTQKKELGEKRSRLFSWRKMVEQTIKIYESSLSLRPNK